MFGYTIVKKSFIDDLQEQIAYYGNEADGYRDAYENAQAMVNQLKTKLDDNVKTLSGLNTRVNDLLRRLMKTSKTVRHLENELEKAKAKKW